MFFTPTGTFYSKVQFKTEDEVEKVVAVMNRETKNKDRKELKSLGNSEQFKLKELARSVENRLSTTST